MVFDGSGNLVSEFSMTGTTTAARGIVSFSDGSSATAERFPFHRDSTSPTFWVRRDSRGKLRDTLSDTTDVSLSRGRGVWSPRTFAVPTPWGELLTLRSDFLGVVRQAISPKFDTVRITILRTTDVFRTRRELMELTALSERRARTSTRTPEMVPARKFPNSMLGAVDPTGTIWIGRALPSGEQRSNEQGSTTDAPQSLFRERVAYVGFNRNGQLIGEFSGDIPREPARLMSVWGKHLWTVEEREDGSMALVRYRIGS
jgi:hypothetical protein